ncbi:protein of unknown function (plasmid) [Ralstonia solanacearum PSI07]|nr:protein of unknown function [Ralstonia solanacearum PSI07]
MCSTGAVSASTAPALRAPGGGGEQRGPNPTDRGKLGSKRHVAVDAYGIPLAGVVTVLIAMIR